MGRRNFAAALVCLLLVRAAPARAQTAPHSTVGGYSAYEKESIVAAQKALGVRLDSAPEGKVIERIDILRLEVIENRDPAPEFLNRFHTTSRERIIRQELLLHEGDRYVGVVADETSRNLRRLSQVSLVVVTALEGSRPDRVRLLVIAKDVWSLRLNSNFTVGPGGLESLLIEPTESNLAGEQQSLATRFILFPLSYTLGAGYRIPRLSGRWLTFVSDANIIINRASGRPEGSYGTVSISRPLYSTRTEWGWGINVAWREEIVRHYVNAKLAGFGAVGTPQVDKIPWEYRAQRYTNTYGVTRSFGWATKSDITFGGELNRRAYRTGDLSRFDPVAVTEFINTAVPVSDTRVGPFLQYRGYTTNFIRVLDFETLGLQEDFRLGHDVWLKVYPVTRALGSSRNFFGTYAAAQYTVALGDGLVRGAIESDTEAEVDRLSDASVVGSVRIVTPRLGFGRFVYDAYVGNRYRNFLNHTDFLGGNGRLRGYPSNFFVGKDVVASNLEYRSRPVEILSLQLGGAVFYDVGDAFSGFDHLRPRHSVGVGFRALFPQLDRFVFRGDLGFPVGRPLPSGVFATSFFFAFEQAFPVPGVGSTAPYGVPTVGGVGALGQ